MEIACLRYGDGKARFHVFTTADHKDRRSVFVTRSTGDCGGCGASTVVVVFRNNRVELVEELGEYGRFGKGPDAIRLRDVVGQPVIEVDHSISRNDRVTKFREYFAVDRDRVELSLCLQIAESDAQPDSAWTSRVSIMAEGTMYFVPSYKIPDAAGVKPTLLAHSFPFEHGRWRLHEDEVKCLDPRWYDEPVRR